MTLSKRHHYLPQFYIKGFVGNDGKVAVYNKEKDKIDKIRKSPKQLFYEYNRNTFEIDEKKLILLKNCTHLAKTNLFLLIKKL